MRSRKSQNTVQITDVKSILFHLLLLLDLRVEYTILPVAGFPDCKCLTSIMTSQIRDKEFYSNPGDKVRQDNVCALQLYEMNHTTTHDVSHCYSLLLLAWPLPIHSNDVWSLYQILQLPSIRLLRHISSYCTLYKSLLIFWDLRPDGIWSKLFHNLWLHRLFIICATILCSLF